MAEPKQRLGATRTLHSPSSSNRFARWLGPELWRTLVAIISCGLLLQQLPWQAGAIAQQNQQTVSLEAAQLSDTKVRLTWRISNPSSIIAIRILRSETSPLSGFEVVGTTGASAIDFIDGTVNIKITYYYQVRTVSPTNVAARPSNVFTIKVLPTIPATPPPTPTPTPVPTVTPTPTPTATVTPSPSPAPGSLPGIYVAPHGSPGGDGSWTKPLDLATALSNRSAARPGDTIWLRGGTYRGAFTSELTGTANAPIIVRQYPGERAIIDGAGPSEHTFTVNGAWAIYWGFEITNSLLDRTKLRPNGLSILGPHTKFINLIIHDTGVGVGAWTPALEAEITGCIIFHNGWQTSVEDRGHGHGIYIQNDTGTKHVFDNIIFDQYGYGIHAYTERGTLRGFYFEGNTVFSSGSASLPANADFPNILIGGFQPVERLTLIGNYLYHPLNNPTFNCTLYYVSGNNREAALRDNYFAGGAKVLLMQEWQSVVGTGNTFIGASKLIGLDPGATTPSPDYVWDQNQYVLVNASPTLEPFAYGPRFTYNFDGWQKATNFDRNGRFTQITTGRPTGAKIFVRPNRYEAGRANLSIYNWDLQAAIAVKAADLSAVLQPGDRYEVRNVRDLFGHPVLSGVYNGGDLSVPMTANSAVQEFAAFVLQRAVVANVPTPVPTPTLTPKPSPTPTPTPTPGATVDPTALPLDAEEQALFNRLNDYRRTINLGPLGLAISLTNAATWAAKDMAARNYISKIDSLGRSPSQRARAFGYPGELGAVREDALVLAGELGGDAICELWQSSQLSNAVLTQPGWKVAGIGRAFNAHSRRWHWQVLFGSFWDKTQPLAGEDEEGRINGNPLMRTRPPSDALVAQHYVTGYGAEDEPYSPIHCDLNTEPQTCWHDPPPQISLRLREPTALEYLFGLWEVLYQSSAQGIVHANYGDFDNTGIVTELRINENGSWSARGYRAFTTPTPLESGAWQAVLDSARNEILLTLTRANRLPRATLRVHATKEQLTFFAVDGGALMKNFFRGWPADESATDDPQIIFGPKLTVANSAEAMMKKAKGLE